MRILRGLTTRLLPCGCIAGVYETYNGAVVTLLDDRDSSCGDPSHVDGIELPEFAGIRPTSEVTLHPNRQSKS